MKSVNFGIDLGTTNSLIAKYENGKVIVYKNPVGHKESLPSVVGYRKDRILIGDKAKELLTKDPVNVFGSFKRKMGSDEKYYVVNIDDNVTPIDLSALLLKELKGFVPNNENLEAIVITIPASFDSMQSNATLEAGRKAGFKEVLLLQEPIAASLAYFNQSNHAENKDGYWLVYDLGGGTFDVALVSIKEGNMSIIDHEGNNFLGGIDFDFILIEKLLVPEIERQTGKTNFLEQLLTPNGPYEKLYNQILFKAEEAKIELSNYSNTDIELEIDDEYYTITIEQNEFQNAIAQKVQLTIDLLHKILTRNHIQPEQIQQIIMVGGSTYSPFIRQQLSTATNIYVNTSVDPTTAIAVGAAYYAANKYYQPQNNLVLEDGKEVGIDDLLNSVLAASIEEQYKDWDIHVTYSKMSKDDEELLLIKAQTNNESYYYRILRQDGGFDTGIVPGKAKLTEFIPLMPQVINSFTLKIYNSEQIEITQLQQEIVISHGQYNIDGQPLPKDICLEVDDIENKETKLEVIFERNSLIPQRKTLYREAAKTVRKGSTDTIIINILEGDKLSRPISNLPIGYITIHGKDLNSDLIKGSDIEIKLSISESRIITTEVYLVMTDQTFENQFNFSQRVINEERLIQQYFELEEELRDTCKNMQYYDDHPYLEQVEQCLNELVSYQDDIKQLKKNSKSDKKYIIADAVSRISKEYDQIGGQDRLTYLREEYLHYKTAIEDNLNNVDFDKERLIKEYEKLQQQDATILKSSNSSTIEKGITKLSDFNLHILHSNIPYLLNRYQQYQDEKFEDYSNKNEIISMVKRGELALKKESYKDLRTIMYNIYFLINKNYASARNSNEPFSGTGIG